MANKNKEIIEAEYREVSVGCTLPEITAEIRYITESLNRTVLTGIIEIGKRFEMAKSLVEHGKWGEYCEEYTGYSQSMAENYIKVYKEYGSEQQSLFGDFTKSQSIGNLGITKLIELTALPADEREKFVEDNNVTEDTTVKELRELIKHQDAQLTEAASKQEETEKKLADNIKSNNRLITEKQAEIDRLQKELENRSAENAPAPSDEMAKMIAEAETNAKAELQKEIARLTEEKNKAVAANDKNKEKLDKLKKDNSELKNSLSEAESVNAEMRTELDKLHKSAQVGANENMVRLNICLETAQRNIQELHTALDAIKDCAEYEKLRPAVTNVLRNMLDEMAGGKNGQTD